MNVNLFQDCVLGRLETRRYSDDGECQGVRYLKKKAVCCNGGVHHFPAGDTLGCCISSNFAQTIYSESTQICCHGNVHHMSANEAE